MSSGPRYRTPTLRYRTPTRRLGVSICSAFRPLGPRYLRRASRARSAQYAVASPGRLAEGARLIISGQTDLET